MKTPEDILTRIKAVEKDDWLGAQRGDLIAFLPYEHAKTFLKPEVKAEEWKPLPNTPEAIKAAMFSYLPFAWEKANNCRGISASRSIDHMRAWLWLLDEERALVQMDNVYEFYGKPCLVICSRICGFDWRKVDNGDWQNDEDGRGLCTPQQGLARYSLPLED